MRNMRRIQNLAQAPQHRGAFEALITAHFPQGHATQASQKLSVAQEFAPLLNPLNAHQCLFIEALNEVLATLSWKSFEVHSREGALRVAALGLVVTDPEHRGQGLSSALMREAETQALNEGCALMLLWSDKIDHYLARGYLLIGGELNFHIPTSHRVFRTPAPPSFRDNQNFHIEAALEMYRKMGLGPKRSKSLYEYFVSLPSTYALQTDKAYLLAGKARDLHNVVHEIVGDPCDYASLLSALQIKMQASQNIQLQIPEAHPQRSFFENLFGPTPQGPWVFAKILNPKQIIKFLTPALKAHGLGMDIKNGKWRLLSGSSLQNSAVLFESQDVGHILQILWNPLPIQSIEGLPDTVKEALKNWRVPSLYFWGMDSV